MNPFESIENAIACDIEESIGDDAMWLFHNIKFPGTVACTQLRCDRTWSAMEEHYGPLEGPLAKATIAACHATSRFTQTGVFFVSAEVVACLFGVDSSSDDLTTAFLFRWRCKGIDTVRGETRAVRLACAHRVLFCERCQLPTSFGMNGEPPTVCAQLGGACCGTLESRVRECGVECTAVINRDAPVGAAFIHGQHHDDLQFKTSLYIKRK